MLSKLVQLLVSSLLLVPPSAFANDALINGKPVPGRVGGKSKMMYTNTYKGTKYTSFRITREPGFRTPIHQHDYPVSICVHQGQVTMLAEGMKPSVQKAGNCFLMPANVRLSTYVSGSEAYVGLDTFVMPEKAPFWRILEHEHQSNKQFQP
jgi:quercetin dioxygenase-like cupin family protein